MKKLTTILLAILLSLSSITTKANEGMWLPFLLGKDVYEQMVQCGLKLTKEQIYSVNSSSLKDAVVALGGGFCTGEIISKQGLMLTNHHCGFGEIQKHSTTEHDYLTDGFWTMNKKQELRADFSVWFLDKMSDVTEDVLKDITDSMSEGERAAAISKAIKGLKEKAAEGKGSEFAVQVKSFYYGNNYYMFTYKIFNDVRLVGAPPSSIGKFGGDTDNWMWPRHTGDFSMFRIYADKDNNPTDYSEDNIPYNPNHFLPVSIAGVKEGDYAMIMGYPGSTDRYLTSIGVKQAVEIEQPARVEIRRKKLDIMEEGMNKDQKVRIQYASKHARVSNYWKYFLGQSRQLVKNNVYDKKKELEDIFNLEAKKIDDKYKDALKLVEESKLSSEKYIIPNVYFEEAIYQGPELFSFILNNFGFNSDYMSVIQNKDENKTADVDSPVSNVKSQILQNASDFYKDYNAEIDKNIMAAMLEMYITDVPSEFHPEYLKKIAKKYKNNFTKFADKYYDKSPFTSEEKFTSWVNNSLSVDNLKKDAVYNLATDFLTLYIQSVMMPQQSYKADFTRGMRLFVDGLNKMGSNKASDANSTMRVTFGNVLSYDVKDAVKYNFYTTLEGVMEKQVQTNNKNHEFYVPSELKLLYESKDYGQYANEKGELPVGFLSNNDITGGNSGSPVINDRGELIGTAFDGNWEAMSGDIYFEPNIQRTISVDIRYTLFIIDKYAGATHLIDEMNLVNSSLPKGKEGEPGDSPEEPAIRINNESEPYKTEEEILEFERKMLQENDQIDK